MYIDGEVYVAENGTMKRFLGGQAAGWTATDPGDTVIRAAPHYTFLTSPGARGTGTLYGYDKPNAGSSRSTRRSARSSASTASPSAPAGATCGACTWSPVTTAIRRRLLDRWQAFLQLGAEAGRDTDTSRHARARNVCSAVGLGGCAVGVGPRVGRVIGLAGGFLGKSAAP